MSGRDRPVRSGRRRGRRQGVERIEMGQTEGAAKRGYLKTRKGEV